MTRIDAAGQTPPTASGRRRDGVGAVVVTYFPDAQALAGLMASLSPQVTAALIVDNTPAAHAAGPGAAPDRCTVLRFGENRGVAAAHNAGIGWARQQGFDQVLLLDQDSAPAADMVFRLREAAAGLLARGIPLAAVGPRYIDPRSGRSSYATRIARLGARRINCPGGNNEPAIETDVLISSGMLIRLETLGEIGPMEEELFIDHVDHEWCLRARRRGYRCFLVCDAVLTHHLGAETVRYWFGRWRQAPQHSPWRHYQMLRNALLLAHRRYVPIAWSLSALRRLLSVLTVALVLLPQRRLRLALILRALWDGLRGRSGPPPAQAPNRFLNSD